MRSPGQSPLAAELRHPNRTLHGPEVRVGQRYINCVQFCGKPQLPPICRDHVCGRWQARRTTEFRHNLPAGVTVLCATGVFCIGKDATLAGAEPHCFFERPGSIGVERDSRLRKAFRERGNGFHLLRASEHSTFQFEVLEPISRFGSFGQLQNRLCRERLFMAQSEPFVIRRFVALIGQIGLLSVSNKKEGTPRN